MHAWLTLEILESLAIRQIVGFDPAGGSSGVIDVVGAAVVGKASLPARRERTRFWLEKSGHRLSTWAGWEGEPDGRIANRVGSGPDRVSHISASEVLIRSYSHLRPAPLL